MALVTPAEFRTFTGLTETDARLTVAISVSETVVARKLGLSSLERATYTDKPHTGRGNTALALQSLNIDTDATLTIKIRHHGSQPVTVDIDHYRVTDARRGIVTLLGYFGGEVFDNDPFTHAYSRYESGPGWPKERGSILVTMTGGYDTDTNPAPDDLKQVIFAMAVENLEVAKPIGLANQSEGGYSYGRATRIERGELLDEMLRDWRRDRGGAA